MKNVFVRQGFKKVLGLFLIGILFFSTINNVYAKTLTINEINDEFKTSFIDEFNKLGSNLSSSVDPTNKTLDVYSDSEKIVSFKYTDEYIEYDNRSAVVTQETALDDMGTMLSLGGIINAILNLSGYENRTIPDEDKIDFTNTYDTYGLQIEAEHFEYSGEENGGTWSTSGDFIKYFKMSFDTDKIDALMDKYGIDKDGTKYSNPSEVTPKSQTTITKPSSDTNTNSNASKKDELVENPQTGVSFPIMTVLVLTIVSIIALLYTRKKSVFRKL